MADPQYCTDINALAEELCRTHGTRALDVAIATAKEHLRAAAWKHGAVWLRVANKLSPPTCNYAAAAR